MRHFPYYHAPGRDDRSRGLSGDFTIIMNPESDIVYSLVIPGYNERAVLPLCYAEVARVLNEFAAAQPVEIIFVDDGSTDETANYLRELAKTDARVRYVIFSRNFGKEAAMLAGLSESRGKYIALLDADLQHPPKFLPQMFAQLLAGAADCVAMKRDRTGDPPLRTSLARTFYRLMSFLAELKIVDGVGDFRAMTRDYVNSVLSLPERARFSKGIFPWVGFRLQYIEYQNAERAAGQTKWSLMKLFGYAADGIIAFSDRLLCAISLTGVAAFIFSLMLVLMLIVMKFCGMATVDGITTVACLVVFFGALILLALGIIGEYLAKIYREVKARPPFLIREKN